MKSTILRYSSFLKVSFHAISLFLHKIKMNLVQNFIQNVKTFFSHMIRGFRYSNIFVDQSRQTFGTNKIPTTYKNVMIIAHEKSLKFEKRGFGYRIE